MSRANRRAMRGSARSRRVPARPTTRARGVSIPWIPVLVVVGIAGVVGLVVWLVFQAGQEPSTDNTAAQRAEADASPDLPGQWVNLPAVYGGPYGDTAPHVERDVDYAQDCTEISGQQVCNTNPPVGGPHWGSTSCGSDPSDHPAFCGPVDWGIYNDPWDAESLVHNMEHAGLVLWYNTTDQNIVQELRDLVEDRLNDDVLIVMAPYPEMEEETIAVTGWSRIDKFPVSEYSKERVEAFIDAHKCRFNPENFSGAGC